MFNFLTQSLSSPVLLTLTILYFITSAITTFDVRMQQAVKNGTLPADEPMLPNWVSYIFWLDWILIISLAILNWKFALLIFVIRFLLKVLPVLEIIGNFLMAPFKIKK